ncbi:putative traI domain protein [Escherichia coli P0304816.7]|nr:putative traI domain protein [Escherichia coli P0304816.7]
MYIHCGIDAGYVKGIYVYDEYRAGQIGRQCRELLHRQG